MKIASSWGQAKVLKYKKLNTNNINKFFGGKVYFIIMNA